MRLVTSPQVLAEKEHPEHHDHDAQHHHAETAHADDQHCDRPHTGVQQQDDDGKHADDSPTSAAALPNRTTPGA